jgi:RNA polymerase sigma-54 factor
MRQSLQLKTSLQLTMTPQLQQAIRLLQLSSLELQTEIQTVLDTNFMLERAEESESDPTPDATGNDSQSSNESNSQNNSENNSQSSDESNSSNDTQHNSEVELGTTSTLEKTPDELPVDSNWDDVYETYDGSTSYSRSDDDSEFGYDQNMSTSQSLHDYLTWQMELTPFSERDLAIAEALIDAVNEAGYLSLPLDDIHQGLPAELEIELDEVEAVLHRVQRFDPPGIAARDPGECLLLQLKQLPPDTRWLKQATRVLEQYLNMLASHDFNGLMRRLKVDRSELQAIIGLIQSLNPRPGTELSTTQTDYIVPDAFVAKHKNAWRVELNPDNAPRLRINNQYSSLIKRADNSPDNQSMRNNLQEARWFLKSLQNRNETLLRVAICIVEHQRGFLEYGEEYMKPLVLRDVAETLEMHESTISRVTTQKYLHTPRGIFEFKYFFSSHVSTSDGGEASSIAIRAMIKKLVSEENTVKPLSDSKIAQLLDHEGIKVARRTVAKYRELMGIASSSERKRLS